MPDLTSYTDDDLDALRVAVATELERRATLAAAPEQITATVRRAEDAGVPADTIRAAVETGLTAADLAALTGKD